MEKVELLRVLSLFKYLDYLNSEIKWKEEQLDTLQIEFNEEIQKVLKDIPELKKMYDEKYDINLENLNNKTEFKEDTKISSNKNKSKKVKKLYREIVKLTHPDIIKDNRLNNIYLDATEKYNNNDEFGVYQLCQKLDIEFEFDEKERKILEKSIKTYEQRIKFLDTSYVWSFYHLKDPLERKSVVVEYLKSQFL